MKIERFFPTASLGPFVKEFIVIESDIESESKTLPDTSMVMSFRFRGRIARVEREQKEALPAAAIAGMRKYSRIFHYSGETANLLVLFKEGGLAALSRMPAHELFGINISAEELFLPSEVDEIVERLAEAKSHRDRVQIVEAFLTGKHHNYRPDLLIANAVQLIKQQNGLIRIRELARSLNISQDPFEKRFRALVGASPKQYSSIVRLRHLLLKYPSHSSLTKASYEAGYFDQSHFIKDFRQFTGQAPKDFFKSPQCW